MKNISNEKKPLIPKILITDIWPRSSHSHGCSEALGSAGTTSGMYTIKPFDNVDPIQVYCDMDTYSGGVWTVR